MSRFIEILQDSAGVIEKENKDFTGFYTGGIGSCLVTVYECEKACIMVHDSGRLEISSICNLIKRYGNVKKITLTHGEEICWEHHNPRLVTILEEIGYRGEIFPIEPVAEIFSFQYPLNNEPDALADDTTPDYVESIPNKAERMSMIEINNYFLEVGSERLELDIQFINGSYQPPIGIVHSSDDLLKTVKDQSGYFFQNLAYLEKAHNLGLINMPEELLKIASECRLSEIMNDEFTPERKLEECVRFNRFINRFV